MNGLGSRHYGPLPFLNMAIVSSPIKIFKSYLCDLLRCDWQSLWGPRFAVMIQTQTHKVKTWAADNHGNWRQCPWVWWLHVELQIYFEPDCRIICQVGAIVRFPLQAQMSLYYIIVFFLFLAALKLPVCRQMHQSLMYKSHKSVITSQT